VRRPPSHPHAPQERGLILYTLQHEVKFISFSIASLTTALYYIEQRRRRLLHQVADCRRPHALCDTAEQEPGAKAPKPSYRPATSFFVAPQRRLHVSGYFWPGRHLCEDHIDAPSLFDTRATTLDHRTLPLLMVPHRRPPSSSLAHLVSFHPPRCSQFGSSHVGVTLVAVPHPLAISHVWIWPATATSRREGPTSPKFIGNSNNFGKI
jgi:hypothetical protein